MVKKKNRNIMIMIAVLVAAIIVLPNLNIGSQALVGICEEAGIGDDCTAMREYCEISYSESTCQDFRVYEREAEGCSSADYEYCIAQNSDNTRNCIELGYSFVAECGAPKVQEDCPINLWIEPNCPTNDECLFYEDDFESSDQEYDCEYNDIEDCYDRVSDNECTEECFTCVEGCYDENSGEICYGEECVGDRYLIDEGQPISKIEDCSNNGCMASQGGAGSVCLGSEITCTFGGETYDEYDTVIVCEGDKAVTKTCRSSGIFETRTSITCSEGCVNGICKEEVDLCFDGTVVGQCSDDLPKFCKTDQTLITACSICGCEGNLLCSSEDGQCVTESDMEIECCIVNGEYDWEYNYLCNTVIDEQFCDGIAQPFCGDGRCTGTETQVNCFEDCSKECTNWQKPLASLLDAFWKSNELECGTKAILVLFIVSLIGIAMLGGKK